MISKMVKKGTLLAIIDPREYKLELERLKTDLSVAQIEYEKAQIGLRLEDKEKLEAQVNADESAFLLAEKEKEPKATGRLLDTVA